LLEDASGDQPFIRAHTGLFKVGHVWHRRQ